MTDYQSIKDLPSPRRLYVTVGSITSSGLVLMLQLLHLRLQFRDDPEKKSKRVQTLGATFLIHSILTPLLSKYMEHLPCLLLNVCQLLKYINVKSSVATSPENQVIITSLAPLTSSALISDRWRWKACSLLTPNCSVDTQVVKICHCSYIIEYNIDQMIKQNLIYQFQNEIHYLQSFMFLSQRVIFSQQLLTQNHTHFVTHLAVPYQSNTR